MTLVMSATNVIANETIDLCEINFLKDGHTDGGINGNISLIFDHSDTGNEDVVILNDSIGYLEGPDISLFHFQSLNITYDYNFVNDTKAYYFININNLSANVSYRVLVNYSSIQVPDSPWKALEELLEEKNMTIIEKELIIANLTGDIALLEANISSLYSSITLLNENVQNLQSLYNGLEISYDEYVSSTEGIIDSYWTLVNKSVNQSFEISRLNSNIRNIEKDRDGWKESFEDISGTFSTGYTREGKEEFYFNGTWFIIGGIIFLLIVGIIFLFFRKNPSKTLLGRVSPSGTKPQEWVPTQKPESFVSVEKEFLEEPEYDKIDDIIEKHETKKPKSTKKPNWWDTPAGEARKKELRNQMKDINKAKKGT